MELTRQHRQVSQLSRQTKLKENKTPAEHVVPPGTKSYEGNEALFWNLLLEFLFGSAEGWGEGLEGWGEGREVLKPWQFVENRIVTTPGSGRKERPCCWKLLCLQTWGGLLASRLTLPTSYRETGLPEARL